MKIIFETEYEQEAKKILNVDSFVSALIKLKQLRRNLSKGYDNDVKFLKEGEVHNQQEAIYLENIEMSFIEVDTLIDKIDTLLEDVNQTLEEIYY